MKVREDKAEFQAPMQGYYAGTVSQKLRDTWETER